MMSANERALLDLIESLRLEQQRDGGGHMGTAVKALQGFVRLASALTLKWEAEARHYSMQARYYEASAEQTELGNLERKAARIRKDGSP